MTGMGALLIALLMLGGGGSAEASGPLVVFHREYGGFTGGVADVRIARDGRTVASSRRCEEDPRTFRLGRKERRALRRDLRRARRKAHPRTRDEYSSEAPSVDITSGKLRLHYRGFGVAPPAAQPLIDRLDRIATRNC
jgi:hypothetical protein